MPEHLSVEIWYWSMTQSSALRLLRRSLEISGGMAAGRERFVEF